MDNHPGELSTPIGLVNNDFFSLIYLLYIIEMGGCYSTMLWLPEILVFPIPSLIDNTGF